MTQQYSKALVAGGAGFIGSHLVRKLLQEERAESVVVYDNFTSGKEAYLSDFSDDPRLEVVTADLQDAKSLTKATQGADVVFHLAANPDIARAVSEPDIDFWQGTYLAHNVAEAARLSKVPLIYYTSGSGVYGDIPNVAFKESYGPLIPISTYAASKLACESLFSAYAHMFGLTVRAFRFANVVGPRQTHGVGYDFVRRLAANPFALRILGDGTQSKSYIHVDDVLRAIFAVPTTRSVPFDVFNVATGDYVTVREIADLAVEISGLTKGNVAYEFTGGDRGWKGDVPVVRFNCDKIEALGWKCQRTSKEALCDAMSAMREEIRG